MENEKAEVDVVRTEVVEIDKSPRATSFSNINSIVSALETPEGMRFCSCCHLSVTMDPHW